MEIILFIVIRKSQNFNTIRQGKSQNQMIFLMAKRESYTIVGLKFNLDHLILTTTMLTLLGLVVAVRKLGEASLTLQVIEMLYTGVADVTGSLTLKIMAGSSLLWYNILESSGSNVWGQVLNKSNV